MSPQPATIKVWADSLSTPVPCGYHACRRLIRWSEVTVSGKKMPFTAPAAPLYLETDPVTRRSVAVMKWDDNHWSTCPGASEFKRPTPPAPSQQNAREREAAKRRQNPTLGGLFTED